MDKRKNNKITFRVTTDLDTLEQVISVLENNCTKKFLDKLKRAYDRQRRYQLGADTRVTKSIMPKYLEN